MQYGTNMEEPSGPPEGVLDRWLVTRIWYMVASLLASWAPPQEWPNVSGTPDTIEKALQVVRETLEKPSSHAAERGAMGWVFLLCKLRQRLCFTMPQNYMNSKGEEKPWKPGAAP